tara:strand:- start:1033 stop:1824 length:792 start_codon:yes stop_codon:yes gene_type:complete
MARSRNIKPGLFDNEILGEADPIYTVLFAGLWTLADREGRLEDRPARIKKNILGYRDADSCLLLEWLNHESFIKRYSIDGKNYIQILNWTKHQNPHHKEAKSVIPKFIKGQESEIIDKKQQDTNTKPMDESSMNHEQTMQNASCPTDSLNLIPDSLNLIPSGTTDVDSNPPKKITKKFSKPEPQELIAHFESKGSNSNEAEKFFNYYESNGWKVGKNPMKNWKAAAANWLKNNMTTPPSHSGQPADNYATAAASKQRLTDTDW